MNKVSFFNVIDSVSNMILNNPNIDEIKGKFESLDDALSDRVNTVECQEPDSDGAVHDNWEEKLDGLSDLRDIITDILYCGDDDVSGIMNHIEDFVESAYEYQDTYGGLKRLMVEF